MLFPLLIVMTAGAVLAVLVPLARRRSSAAPDETSIYRDQLAEIDRDRASGAIGAKEAEAARAEVARRLISASEAGSDSAPAVGSASRRRIVAVLALVGLPLAAAAIYAALGRPDLPDRPLAAARPPATESIQALVARVEQELARRPDDGRGWEAIAPVYLRIGQSQKAADAFANAIRLLGPSAEREASLGEALTAAAGGQVTPEAKAAFQRALELDAGNVQGRFYLARAAMQAGDYEEASEIYRSLLEQAPRDAPFAGALREALVAAATGRDGSAPASGTGEAATIRGMVERLDERLKSEPADVASHVRLIRSWAVLGETEKARDSAGRARNALAADAAALRRIDNLMIGLGLEDLRQ